MWTRTNPSGAFMDVNANQIVGPMWDNGSPCNNNLTYIISFPFHVNVSCTPSIWDNSELWYLLQWDNRPGFRRPFQSSPRRLAYCLWKIRAWHQPMRLIVKAKVATKEKQQEKPQERVQQWSAAATHGKITTSARGFKRIWDVQCMDTYTYTHTYTCTMIARAELGLFFLSCHSGSVVLWPIDRPRCGGIHFHWNVKRCRWLSAL